ncbi:hypothetical protein [Butyrivibrio sp. AE2032]|uniref:hypothetical protein n=1 Tax=Butyrivibrio sp. AE2032 TaxID=1458463 RepID=UPI0005538520|nr:hypothetical protein [Butyrivibrio sp. AE2032]
MNSSKSKKKIYIAEVVVVLFYLGQMLFFHFNAELLVDYDRFKRYFVYLVIIFSFINLVICFRDKSPEEQKAWLVVLLVTFLSSIPLMFKGINMNGHDIEFHVFRVEGLLQELRMGHIPARIYSMWCNGYGYPAPIFYGDVLLIFPAVLRIFGFSITTAFKFFIFAVNLATAIISVICFEKLFNSQKIAHLLAFAFCLNPYRLTDVFIRHAVGEYCAMIFFPLIAFAFVMIYEGGYVYSILLALGMTGVVLTHTLSIEIVSFALLVFFIIRFRESFKIRTIKLFALAVFFTTLLSAFFVVPLADYLIRAMTMSTVSVNSGLKIQGSGISIAELFTFFANDPDSHVQLTPGIFLFLVLGLAIWLIIKGLATKEIKVLTITSALFLLMSTNVFPWNLIADIKVLNIITQVQFAWRYLGVACITLTLLLGYILKEQKIRNVLCDQYKINVSRYCVILTTVTSLVFVSLFAFDPSLYYYEERDTYFPQGLAEYSRVGIGDSGYVQTDFELYTGEVFGDFESVEILDNTGLNMTVAIRNKQKEVQVVLPRTNYPGYRVGDDFGNSYDVYDSDNLLVAFDLPAGFDGKIYLSYVQPWYWNVALAVSIIAVMGLILFLCFSKRRNWRHSGE